MDNPADLLDHLRERTSHHGKVMAVSMMKDEAPFLLEWFAHHLAVGFTDILVYTNDCSDGTDLMLMRLEEMGLGYHRPNVIAEGIKPQPSALKHAQVEPLVREADWLLVFDADEFLSINHPSGTLDGMLDDAVARGANGIVITWRIFGSAGVVEWSRAPVTEQYLRAAPALWNKGWGVKTLFKFDNEYWKLGIHRPSIKNKHLEDGYPDTVQWLNGSGHPMEDYFKFRGWRSIRRTVGYDWAQMNHYAVKSVDSYAVRKFRGNVNNKKDKYNADYWSLQDRNEVECRNILKHAPERDRIMEALLTDPELNRLHYEALERVEARLDEYRQTEAYQTLKSGLVEAGKVPITQVSAKPPKARDPAKIAALMSRVEQKANNLPPEKRANADAPQLGGSEEGPYAPPMIDLSVDTGAQLIPNHDIKLMADTRLFQPETLNAVLAGRFDRRNARKIEGYLDGCTRLVDIGTGIGFIPMRIIQLMPQMTVLAQDRRSDLIRIAHQLTQINGLDDTARLKLTDGPLIFDSDATDQASGLRAILQDFRPDCLRVSGILDNAAARIPNLPLDTVKRVVLPFASADDMTKLREEYTAALNAKGFNETPDRDGSGSLQFDR